MASSSRFHVGLFLRHRPRRLAGIVLLFAASLAACSRRAEPAARTGPEPAAAAAAGSSEPAHPPSSHPTMNPANEAAPPDKARGAALMAAIFGQEYDAGKAAARVVVEEDDDARYYLMTLKAATELPDGRTVAIVNGAPSDDDGEAILGHSSPGMLNVFTLEHRDGGWQVVGRHVNVTFAGSFNDIGSVKWIDLGPGKPGFVLSSGGTWQGYTKLDAEIYDLSQDPGDGVRSLGSFSEMSGNRGGCAPDADECWETEGRIGTVDAASPGGFRDIVVDFSDKRFRVVEDARGEPVEQLKSTVRQTARYRFDGKQYVLVSGVNPVRDI